MDTYLSELPIVSAQAACVGPLIPAQSVGLLRASCGPTIGQTGGISLWDSKTIKKGLNSHRQPKTDLKFTASDSLSEKAKLLDVSATLGAGILGGLVNVSGSAKFLYDNKTSARQCRVTMQYSQTTRYEEFTMDRNITYPKVFEDETATHVVTAVLYGAQAFMVFDLTADEFEKTKEMEGTLTVMVTGIPFVEIEGVGSLKMNDNEKQLSDKISCTFYGDYDLELNPTTYMEALQVYKELPSLLRKRENDAVPMKVWLYPLAHLSKKAAKLEREIHKTLITKTESLLEDLVNADIKCNDLITTTTVNYFPDVRQRVRTLQSLLQVYKVMFLKALHRLIPAIRSGKEQEQALADVIAIHHKSPFTATKLNQWFENNQNELYLLNLFTQQLSGAPVVKYSAMLSKILIDPSIDILVCFSFTSLKYEDPYLSTLTKFLKVPEFENLVQVTESTKQLWFQDQKLSEKIRNNLSTFRSFFLANKDDPEIRFIVVSASDPSNPGMSVHFYKKGKMVDRAFEPVSKPPAPKVDIQDRNMILSLQKSPTGLTVRFRVEYRTTQATDSEADVEKWEVIETSDAQENFTLTGIMPANQYWVRYRAVSEAGVSEASDSVVFIHQGKLHFSVSKNWNWSFWSIINELRTQILGKLCTSWWSLSNIQTEMSILSINPVYLNSRRLCFFKHRIPITKVKALYIHGDVILNSVGVVEKWKTSSFGKGQCSGISHWELSNIQSDVKYPLCKPNQPYFYPIAEGLKPGMALFFQGVVPVGSKGFELNLKVGPNERDKNIIHMKSYLSDVAFRNAGWEKQEWIRDPIFAEGEAFDVFILVGQIGYYVIVNGRYFYEFNEYIPISDVSVIHISGNVFMNTFAIFQMDNATLTFDIAALM
ncbi:neoverrucotoxin subunit beta-like [Clarias magur]|uniref:Neoverrucotoxin subunit beta-like n=1 Tax=Clarias magur TaxID=1594786 RepID=A0A8J4TZS0_CLAMG|nr:neoverrucotoxin subunit beta-like [Clarias magur]